MLNARTVGSLGVCGACAYIAERAALAFHEAGHSLIAVHFADSGLHSDQGKSLRFTIATPILRFATITPRVTSKGQNYLGETKLTVRWRDMHSHVECSAAKLAPPPSTTTPILQSAALGAGDTSWLVGFARMAYLFGGRIAEERLAASFRHVAMPPIEERVAQCIAKPRTARGDLRKAKQVVRATLALDPLALDPLALDAECLPGLEAAFGFADSILSVRWSECCALAGALFVRGTVDGAQHLELMRQHDRHCTTDSTHADMGARLLDLVAPYPFCFGCVYPRARAPTQAGWRRVRRPLSSAFAHSLSRRVRSPRCQVGPSHGSQGRAQAWHPTARRRGDKSQWRSPWRRRASRFMLLLLPPFPATPQPAVAYKWKSLPTRIDLAQATT